MATTMRKHASTMSAVCRGTAFEQRSLQLLQAHFSMALQRVGGKSDGGIDLVGWWWLPFATESDPIHRPGAALHDADGLLRRRLRILAQCKAEKKKLGPKIVREMEGVWHLQSRPAPSLSVHRYPTVALLLSESPFSQSAVLHAYRSTVPFLLVHLPAPEPNMNPQSTGETVTGTLCPNPALTHLVQPLAFCWERHPTTDPSTDMGGRPGLWWQGRRLDSWTPDGVSSDTT